MLAVQKHPAHALRRDARIAARSFTQFAFPISPRFRKSLVGMLSVSVLLVWGAWVPARSHAADPDAHPPVVRQA